jgi:hypothetical protein
VARHITGCRSARGLELHHLVHRADGGSHDASNILLACSSCHQSHHAGTLKISGTADHVEVHRPWQAAGGRDVAIHTRATGRTDAHMGVADAASPLAGAAEVTSPDASAGVHVDAASRGSRVAPSITKADTVEHRSSRLDAAVLRTQAKAALTALGWKSTVAHAAVATAVAAHPGELTLERLIFESLRRCPDSRA